MSEQDQKSKDAAPQGPQTDPNVIGNPASILGIFLVFGIVVIAASLGGAQSSSVIVNIKKVWAALTGK